MDTRTRQKTNLDFDTRLELVGIAMDVTMSGSTKEAHRAVDEAVAEAQKYAAERGRDLDVGQRPDEHEPHPVLAAAGKLIRERGWCPRNWTGENGAVCTLKAIRLVTGPDQAAEDDAVRSLVKRIDRVGSRRGPGAIAAWNDAHGRTLGDVLRVLY